MSELIYLAGPYSDSDPTVRERRYWAVLDALARYTEAGRIVYSPVVHCRQIAQHAELPGGYDYWGEHNRAMIERSTAVWVLMLPGYATSEGIRAEIEYARSRLIPVLLIDPAWEVPS